MLQKNGDFIFLVSVISNSCAGQNVAKLGHFTTVARLICRAAFRGMGVHQFLASKNTHGRFQATDWGYSSSPILSFRQSGDVPRRIGDWPAGHLDALDLEVHAAHPNSRLVDRGDLATRYRCPSAGYRLSAL